MSPVTGIGTLPVAAPKYDVEATKKSDSIEPRSNDDTKTPKPKSQHSTVSPEDAADPTVPKHVNSSVESRTVSTSQQQESPLAKSSSECDNNDNATTTTNDSEQNNDAVANLKEVKLDYSNAMESAVDASSTTTSKPEVSLQTTAVDKEQGEEKPMTQETEKLSEPSPTEEEVMGDVKMEEVVTTAPVEDAKEAAESTTGGTAEAKSPSTTISSDTKETTGTNNDKSNENETVPSAVEAPVGGDDSEMKDAQVEASVSAPKQDESKHKKDDAEVAVGKDSEMKDAKVEASVSAPKQDESNLSQDVKENEFMAEEDDADDEEVEPSSLVDLVEVLDGIDTPGSTCAAGPATCLPSIPGLCVEGVGDISLPISDAQAKLLASVAEQAPHGKGMETVVDKSVRNTLQVDPSKVTLQNPAWVPALRKIVQQAAESLGVSPDLVRAELYKLLLYEPGGFFKKHRDTEKAHGMFATLVIQLPSKFTGGSFVVSHGGESETFALGASSDAAYGCHFVCHYADCEHEIRKVESGHRLALIYSLCYTGPVNIKPSAADVEHNQLSTVLKSLPPDESLFVIPLEHQYTTASLARLGAGALKGSDRAKQSAIETSGKGDWKMIVAKAERTDYESGGGDGYYGGFDVYDVERGSVHLSDAYNADGSDANDHLGWIRKQISFESVEEGGMMLVSADELEDDGAIVWGEGDSGSVEYTGNEGATRETTYSTYVLLVYSEKTGFERMCASEFSSAVSHVLQEENAHLMRRILSYMKSKKASISNGDGVRLLQATHVIGIPESETLLAFQTIVSALSGNAKDMPSTQLTGALISSVQRFGWTNAADPIKAYTAELVARKDLTMIDFLKKVDFLLRMQKTSDSGDFDQFLSTSINEFVAGTNNPSTASSYGSYSYTYNRQYNSSTQATADALVSLCQQHPREKTKSVVQACVARMRKQEGTATDKLAQRASLLQRLRPLHDSKDVESWFHGVVEDFITTVEKLPSRAPASTRYGGSVDVLSSSHADELFRRLFEFGTTNDIHRVERWAMNAQLGQLSKLEKILNRVVTSASVAAVFRDSAAVHALIPAVQSRIKTLKLSELHTRYQKLLTATQGGEPVFSWSMTQAATSNPALTAFLRSARTGPETIVVGGGINHARTLAGASRHSYSYGRYSSSNRSPDPVKQGYSATIEATRATGRNAAVRVTKTRALHDALVKKYREDLSELTKTAEEIRKLGGTAAASLPAGTMNATAVRPVINIDGAESQPNPAKKRRVKAPIPSDAEIVEIE